MKKWARTGLKRKYSKTPSKQKNRSKQNCPKISLISTSQEPSEVLQNLYKKNLQHFLTIKYQKIAATLNEKNRNSNYAIFLSKFRNQSQGEGSLSFCFNLFACSGFYQGWKSWDWELIFQDKSKERGERLALCNHTNNNFFSFWHLLWQEKKKIWNNFAHFHFSNFPCFSPPINHVAPIVVFASGICFLVGGIFPPLLFLHSSSTTYLYEQLTDLFQKIALDSTILHALMKYISLCNSRCLLCIISLA